MYQIIVRNGRYIVARVHGNTEQPARNWKALAADARAVVETFTRLNTPEDKTPPPLHAGSYPCPIWLAERAQ